MLAQAVPAAAPPTSPDAGPLRMFPLPPRAPAVAPPAAIGLGPAPAVASAEAADGAIAERMMRALDSYRTLAEGRRAEALDTAS